MQANRELAGDRLHSYRAKRSPKTTPEPFDETSGERPGVFVVQKHAARSVHFDLRLEWAGALLSWAIPKGPSLETYEKRLAIRTEDHPLEYVDFEGIIPEGNYGAGAMIVWDRGRWIPLNDPGAGLEKGKLLFELKGYKLGGIWTLVRTTRKETEWLLIKKPDEWSRPEGQEGWFSQESVLSGLTVEELAEGPAKAKEIEDQVKDLEVPEARISIDEVEVMLAETAAKPFRKEGWFFELKYDGYRLIGARDEGRVRLRYRSGRDATKHFPEITRSLAAMPFVSFIIDGEVVVADEEGRPDFQLLQRRALRQADSDEIERLTLELPVTFWVFDLICFGNSDLRTLSLRERKLLLEKMLPTTGPVRYADHFETRGIELFDEVAGRGLEGIVAKEAKSPYRAGRHRQWQKIHASSVSDFVVVGYTLPKGSRLPFGALHLGAFDGSELVYAGRVGTGFSQSQLIEIGVQLDQLVRQTPALVTGVPEGKGHVWVEPKLVATVRFKEWTWEGRLRQPSFLRLKADKPLQECFVPGERASVLKGEASSGRQAKIEVERIVHFTNRDKLIWPNNGYTKGALIDYYRQISRWILPYLRDRLVVLDRYPDGILGKSFFQKNAPEFIPDWLRTEQLWAKDSTRGNNYFVSDNEESLLYLANLASIPLHVWSSRVDTLQYPDWCILDLDPVEVPFQEVVRVAKKIHTICRKNGVESFVKTSGGKGLHILIPLGASYTFEQSRLLAELLARLTVASVPQLATTKRQLDQRSGKIYIDYLQNGYGKLLVAPYSLRPFEGAPVSTPLCWEELEDGLDPLQFNIETLPDRMNELNEDPLCGILRVEVDLTQVLSVLAEQVCDMD
jgi:bifunctional non-homologous end joining protein LigD